MYWSVELVDDTNGVVVVDVVDVNVDQSCAGDLIVDIDNKQGFVVVGDNFDIVSFDVSTGDLSYDVGSGVDNGGAGVVCVVVNDSVVDADLGSVV